MSRGIFFLVRNLFNTIRVRLLLIFLLFTFILAVATFTFYKIYEEQEADDELKDAVHSLSSRLLLLNNYELQFVLNDLKNNKFFQNGESYNIKMHKEILTGIMRDLDKLNVNKINSPSAIDELNKLRNDLYSYNDTYAVYLEKIKERGFRDYGLEGTMRKYIHDAEHFKYPLDMMNLLLTIRRNEKDYILRKDTSYISKHSNNIDVLLNKISSDATMADTLRGELIQLINNYRFYFNKWVIVDKEIGIDQGIGLSEGLKKYNTSFMVTINKIIDDTTQETIRLGRLNEIILITTLAVSIALSIILSIIFSSLFTKPIIQLSDSMTEIVRSNFSKPAALPKNNSSDEIGALFRNFSWLIDQIYSYIGQVRQNEKVIEESEKKFRAMIERSADMKLLLNERGSIIYFSPSIHRDLEYRQEEVSGKNIFDFVHRDDYQGLYHIIHFLLGKPGAWITINFRIRHQSGKWLYVAGTISNLLDEPAVKALVANIADITVAKLAEERLQLSEKRFKSLIENGNDAIALTDKSGKLLYASPSTQRVLGYIPEEFEGNSMDFVVHPDDFETLHKNYSEVLANPGKMVYMQLRMRHKDGGWRWLEGYCTNLFHDNSVKAAIINYRDVTARKQNEIKIDEQYKELQRINSELDRFVYSASHDLKAPLTSILGIINVARLEPDDTSKAMYFKMAEDNVKRLLNIIKDLTNFSRNERLEVVKDKVDFETMVRDCISSFSYMENSMKISFDINVSQPIDFYSDKIRLGILFNNLISNAIIYHRIDQEIPFINVFVNCGSSLATIIVEDNGKGIEPEYHAKIFDMFYRASQDSLGSGLGLYIVKGIVEKLGGAVELLSTPGVGTKFTIQIPVGQFKSGLVSEKHTAEFVDELKSGV